MTEKRLPIPKYYYGLDGNIRDENYIYETKTMPKEDIDELFYDEKHLGSNSLMDLLNNLHNEKESWRTSFLEEMQDQQEQSKTLVKLMKENEELKGMLEASQERIIYEYSSHINEDLEELSEVFSNGDIEEIKKFVRG